VKTLQSRLPPCRDKEAYAENVKFSCLKKDPRAPSMTPMWFIPIRPMRHGREG